MRFNSRAKLDTSQIQDQRGGGGGGGGLGGLGALGRGGGGLGGAAKGGGALGFVLIIGAVLFFVLRGGGDSTGGAIPNILSGMQGGAGGAPAQVDNSQLQANCQTGEDANNNSDCALVAIVNSVQSYWTSQLAQSGTTYRPAPTVWFTSQVQTGCGAASSGTGPFYCPADQKVYVDLSFFQELKTKFGANDQTFTQAYVLAHEYGHHVQNLLGTSDRVGQAAGDSGASVRLELQADCYAGAWAHNATTVPGADGQVLIADINQNDINGALQAAEAIGDDYIQANLGGGRVDPSQFTHGTSAQRERWFSTGYESGNPADCNTFDTDDLG